MKVDLHTHTYNRVTPLGVDADHFCLGRGVTTAVDTDGSDSGASPGCQGAREGDKAG